MKFSKIPAALAAMTSLLPLGSLKSQNTKPNVIFFLFDDLGVSDLGCYGQKVLKTPNIDQIAKQGIQFNQFYAGSTVCAPSRSTLLTGQHTGHTRVRDNKSIIAKEKMGTDRVPLTPEDYTLAQMFKDQGYATAAFGKWGLGNEGSTGIPNKKGFDKFVGFLDQHQAHNHYTPWFYNNTDTLFFPENNNRKQVTHTHDVFIDSAFKFISQNNNNPFFVFFTITLPHDKYQMPAQALKPFEGKGWTHDQMVYAAMVKRLDDDLGNLVALLKKLNIDSNTVLMIASDNGAANRWDGVFNSSGIYRGHKRDMYEGGIRAPFIAYMPGTISPNLQTDVQGYFPDIMPTLAHLTGAKLPNNIDGINLWSVITGKSQNLPERPLYWEFYEKGFKQALRLGDFKIIKYAKTNTIELFNLKLDPAETKNIASQNKALTNKLLNLLNENHKPSEFWSVEN